MDSVLAQTYSNIRVILVDDGSPDSCPSICDEYAKTDTRIKVIHRKNGGLSAARNSGLSVISEFNEPGNFVSFVDSDDYIAPDFIESLYNLLIENNADISQCGYYIVFSNTKMIDKNSNHKTKILDKVEALKSLCYNGIYDVSACIKLYKLRLFDEIRFPEGYLYEDTASCYLIAEKADRIAVNMTPKYYYRQRIDSIANGLTFNKNKYDLITVGDDLADYVAKNYPRLSNEANVKRVFVRLSTLSQMINTNHYDKERISEIRRIVKKYALHILIDRHTQTRNKVGIVTLLMGFSVYRFCWKLYYSRVRMQ